MKLRPYVGVQDHQIQPPENKVIIAKALYD
jgi:hypothetical protein